MLFRSYTFGVIAQYKKWSGLDIKSTNSRIAAPSYERQGVCSGVPQVFPCDKRSTFGLHVLRKPRQVTWKPRQVSAMLIQCFSIKIKWLNKSTNGRIAAVSCDHPGICSRSCRCTCVTRVVHLGCECSAKESVRPVLKALLLGDIEARE